MPACLGLCSTIPLSKPPRFWRWHQPWSHRLSLLFLPMLPLSTVTTEKNIAHTPDSLTKHMRALKSFLISPGPCAAISSVPYGADQEWAAVWGPCQAGKGPGDVHGPGPGGSRPCYGLGLVTSALCRRELPSTLTSWALPHHPDGEWEFCFLNSHQH